MILDHSRSECWRSGGLPKLQGDLQWTVGLNKFRWPCGLFFQLRNYCKFKKSNALGVSIIFYPTGWCIYYERPNHQNLAWSRIRHLPVLGRGGDKRSKFIFLNCHFLFFLIIFQMIAVGKLQFLLDHNNFDDRKNCSTFTIIISLKKFCFVIPLKKSF